MNRMDSPATDSGGGNSNSSYSRTQLVVMIAVGVVAALCFAGSVVPTGSKGYCNTEHGELLVGYKMLHHNLGKEAQLKYLHWIRQATLRGPRKGGDVHRLLPLIHRTSAKRQKELEALFRDEEPVIYINLAPQSRIGDFIQGTAETQGTVELAVPLFEKSWPARFFLLQGQATRMVAAIASSTANLETNWSRRKWLKDVAKEYEDLREQLVEALRVALL